ncbi:hypothetical protein HNY73_021081 [Argiope bruennichi]|uniref:Uncharacterized protein n=1 Tax=Argiope bruennichi TaxID=94029 RepID=A0A8T0ECT5_ARGBR|nr:hypothetical protein HNY73_021081 [Argiope bruennichi]
MQDHCTILHLSFAFHSQLYVVGHFSLNVLRARNSSSFDQAYLSDIRDRADNVNQRITKLDAREEKNASKRVKKNRGNHKFRSETIGMKTRRISRTLPTPISNTGCVLSHPSDGKNASCYRNSTLSLRLAEEKKSARTPLKYS